MGVRSGVNFGPGNRRIWNDAKGPVRVRGCVTLVKPMEVETVTEDPTVDVVLLRTLERPLGAL